MRRRRLLILLTAISGISSTFANAATFIWTGGGTATAPLSGNWNDASHWSGGLPVSGQSTSLTFGGDGTTTYTASNDIPAVPFVLASMSLVNLSTTGINQLSGGALRFVGGLQGGGGSITARGGSFLISNDIETTSTLQVSSANEAGTVTFAGAIGGAGGLRLFKSTPVTLSAVNTYVGTTDINTSLIVTPSGRTGLGDVLVKLGGALMADSAASVPANNLIKISSGGYVQFDVLNTAAIQRIHSTSLGVVGIGSNSSANIDLTGRPGISIGLNLAGVDGAPAPTLAFSGAITPADQTYRFGGNFATSATSVLAGAALDVSSLLTDGGGARSVRIVNSGFSNGGRMKLTNAGNTYTGGTTIESGSSLYFDTTPLPGQTPLGGGDVTVYGNLIFGGPSGGIGSLPNNIVFKPNSTMHFDNKSTLPMSSSDHWPDARSIQVDGYALRMRGNTTTALTEQVGALNVTGNGRAALDRGAVGVVNVLQFASVQRSNRGTIELQSVQNGAFGVENQFKIADTTGLPLGPNNLLPAWMVGNLAGEGTEKEGDFLKIDANSVLQKADYISGFDPDGITDMTYTSGSYTGTAWGVRMNGFSAGVSGPLTIRGGGLIINSASFNNSDGIFFENNGTPVEGVIYTRGGSNFIGTGGQGIVTAAGITKFGSGTLWLWASNTFSGPVTINEGNLVCYGIGALNDANPNPLIVNQGGQIDLYGNEVTVASLSGSGTVVSSTGGLTGQRFLIVKGSADTTFSGQFKDISGQSLIGLLKDGPGTQTLTGALSYHGPTVTWGGRLVLATPLTTSAWISAQNDSTLAIAPGSKAIIKTGGVSVFSTGKIDLADGKLISSGGDAGSWNGSNYTGLSGLVAAGQNGGTWDGSGLITSMPAALSGLTTLATAKADDINRIGTTFGGISVASGDVLVMYTYAGDANLDGLIDGTDYFYIDSSIGSAATGYANGDFNYDGSIDGTDYFYIDSNFTDQGAPFFAIGEPELLAGVSAVPEPASIVASAFAISGLLPRHRRILSRLRLSNRANFTL